MNRLLSEYKKKKRLIKERLEDFRKVYDSGDEKIFAELAFCLFTPQSRAVTCDKAVRELERSGLLSKGSKRQVRGRLKGVRFPNNKASFFMVARRLFKKNGSFCIKEKLDRCDVYATREYLVKNVKGLGLKEASHFLRNIGMGSDLAILDVHILKNLKRFGVINEIPTSLTKNRYLDIERKMKTFSNGLRIPLDELDLLFWSRQTGIIFK